MLRPRTTLVLTLLPLSLSDKKVGPILASSPKIVNYRKKSCVALPAHPFIQPTILSLADSHLALMGVHTLITSSDSHADIEEISF